MKAGDRRAFKVRGFRFKVIENGAARRVIGRSAEMRIPPSIIPPIELQEKQSSFCHPMPNVVPKLEAVVEALLP
jgi:hypothetical protein